MPDGGQLAYGARHFTYTGKDRELDALALPLHPISAEAPSDFAPPGFARVKSHLIPQSSDAVLSTLGIGKGATQAIVAGLCYCAASVGMVLLNKIALSQYPLQSPTTLLLLQCALCVLLVDVCRAFNLVTPQRLTWPIVKLWLPCNFVFVMMLFSSFMALKFLSVPMLTTLKNLSNLFTILGDLWFYNRRYNIGVWMTLLLMGISAFVGAKTDLEFNFWGYFWQLFNCMCTAGYSLYLRGVMDAVVPHTDNKAPLSEVSMVYLNNLLSLPFLTLLILTDGEYAKVLTDPSWTQLGFQVAALLSAVVSFGISFASLWFLSSSTPTTYSLVGSLNKVPIAVISLFLFQDRNLHNPHNLASVGIGLAAGVVFVIAKTRKAAPTPPSPRKPPVKAMS